MRRLLYALFLLSLLVLSGCSRESTSSLTVGSNQWPGYETLHLAEHLGLFKDVPIKLIELKSATDVISAFEFGQLDIAALTLDEAILVTQAVPDAVVFLVMDISNGADKLIAKPHISTLQDLAGKRVGVEQSALGAFVFSHVLKKSQLEEDEVYLIPSTVDQHLTMMEQDAIDAVVTFEPTSSRLVAEGNIVLFDSREIPNKIVDVLITRKGFLEENISSLKKLVQANWQALDFLQNHPEKAAEIMSPRLAISPQQLLESYEMLILPDQAHNQQILSAELPVTAEELSELMLEENLLHQAPDLQHLITNKVVE
jgi:NitT/TauT family transport system substrate-binding protein